jgi:hypothetical protein
MLFIDRKRYLVLSTGLVGMALFSAVKAEVWNVETSLLGVRYGSSGVGGGSIDTVIYHPLIPTEFSDLFGVTTQTSVVSTTPISGGVGGFNVWISTDVNAKGSVPAPLIGTFSYNSSAPMTCITPESCGSASINFSKISWSSRDADTLSSVRQYNGSAEQVFHVQTDTSNLQNHADAHHRNYYQFEYLNDTLLPAGIYEGMVTINGSAQ